jgi:predicted GTPase
MEIKIALAGNPNCGKTTLFNALTGSRQYVGNWPGVTVEKKEGKLKGHEDVVIQDLPGIYSLSPYTLEEVVARNYLIQEKPDAILNIVDGTNIERNLYLTTQLIEIGIPVVIAVNMMDILRKLTSRKLWIAVAGVAGGIALALGAESSDIQSVCGAITSVISAMTYIIAEASVDKASVLMNCVEVEESETKVGF